MVSLYQVAYHQGGPDLKEALHGREALNALVARNLGVFFIGLSAVVCYLFTPYSLSFLQWHWNTPLVWATAGLAFLCAVLSLAAGIRTGETVRAGYRMELWCYLLSRVLMLVVYELFFRGLLFQFLLSATPLVAAIVFNVLWYGLAHWFSTRRDLVLSLPFGALLCYLTYASGSVYPAILLHLAVALPYEITLLTKSGLFTKNAFI